MGVSSDYAGNNTRGRFRFAASRPIMPGMTDILSHLSAAMRTYVAGYSSRYPGRDVALDDALFDQLRAWRHECRTSEGGGGMCHLVTEILMAERGVSRMAVTYLSPDGDVICCGHYISILPDGTLLDGTADQFGQGHDIRILRPGDAQYGLYRPEFYEDYSPGLYPDELKDWLPFWTGETDWDLQDRMTAERGLCWWVEDPAPMRAYLDARLSYEENSRFELSRQDAKRTQAWITALEDRFPRTSARP